MKKFEVNIDKYGVSLSVKDGQFYIRHKDSKQTIPPDKVRSIALTKSTNITGAAVLLALENDIDVSFVHKDGMPYARLWNSKFGSIATIRKNQLSFSESRDGSLWIKEVITEKIRNQMALILNIVSKDAIDSPSIQSIREKFTSYLLKLNSIRTDDALELANKLRGWEANASKLLFRFISSQLPENFQFDKRSKRPALDPFNATLNYCYGILYNKIEAMIIRSGLDPHIGIFHKDQYNRPVLVFDIIEIFRHWAEYPVIRSFQSEVLIDDYYDKSDKGVFISAKGKKIIIEIFFSYMNEKVTRDTYTAKRMVQMKNYIESFAQKMKNYKPNEIKQSGI